MWNARLFIPLIIWLLSLDRMPETIKLKLLAAIWMKSNKVKTSQQSCVLWSTCETFFFPPLFPTLCPKINAILGPSTETNVMCKMTKIPLVFYGKDIAIGLSFMWEASRASCLLWLISQSCNLCGSTLQSLWDKFRILELHLFWDGGSIYIAQCGPHNALHRSFNCQPVSLYLLSPMFFRDGDGGGSQGGRRREPGRISVRASCTRAAAAPDLPMEADPSEATSETLGGSWRGPPATVRHRPPASPWMRIPARASLQGGCPSDDSRGGDSLSRVRTARQWHPRRRVWWRLDVPSEVKARSDGPGEVAHDDDPSGHGVHGSGLPSPGLTCPSPAPLCILRATSSTSPPNPNHSASSLDALPRSALAPPAGCWDEQWFRSH
jgi:hypothetical protein